jgi:hypothetical protein
LPGSIPAATVARQTGPFWGPAKRSPIDSATPFSLCTGVMTAI